MYSDYTLMHNTYNALPPQIACDTSVAVTITSLLWLPLAHADERPSGIPDSVRAPQLKKVVIKGLNEMPENLHLAAGHLATV